MYRLFCIGSSEAEDMSGLACATHFGLQYPCGRSNRLCGMPYVAGVGERLHDHALGRMPCRRIHLFFLGHDAHQAVCHSGVFTLRVCLQLVDVRVIGLERCSRIEEARLPCIGHACGLKLLRPNGLITLKANYLFLVMRKEEKDIRMLG